MRSEFVAVSLPGEPDVQALSDGRIAFECLTEGSFKGVIASGRLVVGAKQDFGIGAARTGYAGTEGAMPPSFF
jgi:hypothetical protein